MAAEVGAGQSPPAIIWGCTTGRGAFLPTWQLFLDKWGLLGCREAPCCWLRFRLMAFCDNRFKLPVLAAVERRFRERWLLSLFCVDCPDSSRVPKSHLFSLSSPGIRTSSEAVSRL